MRNMKRLVVLLAVCALVGSSVAASAVTWNAWSVGGTATDNGTTVTLQGGDYGSAVWQRANSTATSPGIKSYYSTSDFNGMAVGDLGTLTAWTNITVTPPTPKPFLNLFIETTVGGNTYYAIAAYGGADACSGVLASQTWNIYESCRFVGGSYTDAPGIFSTDWDTLKNYKLSNIGWLNLSPLSSIAYDSSYNADAVRIVYGDTTGTNYPGNAAVIGSLNAPAVPEPMSIMLGIMGLGSIAGFRKIRK